MIVEESRLVDKGFFIKDGYAFYVVFVSTPNLRKPPPFPDELEPIENEDTIFFRRQRLFVTGLRDATIFFLKDGMERNFTENDNLWNTIVQSSTSAGVFENEAVVTLRELFEQKNMDFIAFMDIEQERVGMAVKLEAASLSTQQILDRLSDAIDYVVATINKEQPEVQRPSLEERIRTIIQESEKEDELEDVLGGGGGTGYPFVQAAQQDEKNESHISLFDLLDSGLDMSFEPDAEEEQEKEEEEEEDKQETTEHSTHLEKKTK